MAEMIVAGVFTLLGFLLGAMAALAGKRTGDDK